MPDVWDQANQILNGNQPVNAPAAPASVAPAGGDVWSQAEQIAKQTPAAGTGGSPTVGHEPTLADDARNSASFLGNELAGIAESVPEAIKGTAQVLMHPYDTGMAIGKAAMAQFAKAQQDTDPTSKAFHYVGAIPVIGTPIGQMYDQFEAGDMDSLAKSVGNVAGNILFGKALPSIAAAGADTPEAINAAIQASKNAATKGLEFATGLNKSEPADLVSQALRGSVPKGRLNFKSNLSDLSIPEIDKTAREAGVEIGANGNSIDQLLGPHDNDGLIAKTKQRLYGEFNNILKNKADADIDTTPVANAIRGTITKTMRRTDPAAVKSINELADKYSGKTNILDLDGEYHEANARLGAYYAKNPLARREAEATNPDIAIDVARRNAMSKLIEDYLNRNDVPGQAKEALRRYGAVREFESALMNRKNVALRSAPLNVSEQFAKWSSIGDAIRGAAKIVTSPLSESPVDKFTSGIADIGSGVGKTAIANWVKEQIGTDALLSRAFNKYRNGSAKYAKPFTFGPTQGALGNWLQSVFNPKARNLLEPGPNVRLMPGVETPDSSGPIPGGEPQRNPGYWTPRQVGNLRQLGPASKLSDAAHPLGSQYGDIKEYVPYLNPQTGRLEFVPKNSLPKR